MESLTDAQLLAEWTARRSQPAFALLVRRHISLVHSAARRQVNDPHLAEEVTQAVFVLLASKAGNLGRDVVLAGWLCRAAHFVARDRLKSERRRQQREQLAARMETNSEPADDAVWQQLAPHLDEAVAQLNQTDRSAIVLRFYEQRPLEEIGNALGVGADAAQKRVARALEKLRTIFAGKGVSLSASAVANAIAANAVHTAPAGLAVQISAGAIVAGTSVTTAAFLSMSALHKTIIGITFAAALGTATHQTLQASANRTEAQAIKERNSWRAGELRRLTAENDETARRLAALNLDRDLLNARLASLRSNAQPDSNRPSNPAADLLKTWQARVAQLKQHFENDPGLVIPEMQLLTETDWLMIAKDYPLESQQDLQKALMMTREIGERKFAVEIGAALRAFKSDHQNQDPDDFALLRPYFDPRTDPAILQRWTILPSEFFPQIHLDSRFVVTQLPALTEEKQSMVRLVSSRGSTGVGLSGMKSEQIIAPLYAAYRKANPGSYPKDLAVYRPYAATAEQRAELQKLIEAQALGQ